MTAWHKIKEFFSYKINYIPILLFGLGNVFFSRIVDRVGLPPNWSALFEPETYYYLVFNLVAWSFVSYFCFWKPNRENWREKRKHKAVQGQK